MLQADHAQTLVELRKSNERKSFYKRRYKNLLHQNNGKAVVTEHTEPMTQRNQSILSKVNKERWVKPRKS